MWHYKARFPFLTELLLQACIVMVTYSAFTHQRDQNSMYLVHVFFVYLYNMRACKNQPSVFILIFVCSYGSFQF